MHGIIIELAHVLRFESKAKIQTSYPRRPHHPSPAAVDVWSVAQSPQPHPPPPAVYAPSAATLPHPQPSPAVVDTLSVARAPNPCPHGSC
jgi:hypothetical protein